MLYEVLEYLGVFRYSKRDRLTKEVINGDFTIKDGQLQLPSLKDGQRFAIIGSDLNDGAYVHGSDFLNDEQFNGTVYVFRGNKALFDLVDEMEAWKENHKAQLESAFKSESFGGYSYQKDDNCKSVFDHFKGRLNAFRKV